MNIPRTPLRGRPPLPQWVTWDCFLGTCPDRAIAKELSITPQAVSLRRRLKGIPPFHKNRPEREYKLATKVSP